MVTYRPLRASPENGARVINMLDPTLAAIREGNVHKIRRPQGTLLRNRAKDRIWIREPFYLDRQFDHLAPTAAARRGALPTFASDMKRHVLTHLGRKRFGRELPRIWHRDHLVVVDIHLQNLHQITDAEIRAEGYATREGYAAAWDTNSALAVQAQRWERNPVVVVMMFDYVAEPLPEPVYFREPA